MVKINDAEIKKIAHLARLQINDNEVQHFVNELSEILNLIEETQFVDTENVEPISHPLDITQRLRQDVVERGEFSQESREILQTNAPKLEDSFYLVPLVIE